MAQLLLDMRLYRLFILISEHNGRVFLKFVDVVQHLGRRLIALCCILLHSAHHDILQSFWDIRID